MDIDTSTVDTAREAAEAAEQAAADARDGYYRALAVLVDEHGASRAAEALDVSRARIYQLLAKLDG